MTAYLWYAFGALLLHLEVAGQLGLDRVTASNWIFIIWFTASLLSIGLTLKYRIPLAIAWSIPGLIYLGANLMAGIVILLFGIGGFGRRIIVWLPLPIIMGIFSGGILTYITRMVEAGVDDVLVAGITLGAYLVGRLANTPKCPPVGLAVVIGGIAIHFFGQTEMQQLVIELPTPTVLEMMFSLGAFLGISLPIVIFAMGLGNVQGIEFPMGQDYKVSTNVVTISVELGSIVNSLFGGNAASVARSTAGIVASSRPYPMRNATGKISLQQGWY